jgi:hypothetical protein
VQEHRQIGSLGSAEDRVVLAVSPERVDAGAREVDADDSRVGGVTLDLARRVGGILRRRDEAAAYSTCVSTASLSRLSGKRIATFTCSFDSSARICSGVCTIRIASCPDGNFAW